MSKSKNCIIKQWILLYHLLSNRQSSSAPWSARACRENSSRSDSQERSISRYIKFEHREGEGAVSLRLIIGANCMLIKYCVQSSLCNMLYWFSQINSVLFYLRFSKSPCWRSAARRNWCPSPSSCAQTNSLHRERIRASYRRSSPSSSPRTFRTPWIRWTPRWVLMTWG